LLPGIPFVAAAKIAIWKRALACFYGGIFEELLSRLFLLTLIAWIAAKVWKDNPNVLTTRAFWIAAAAAGFATRRIEINCAGYCPAAVGDAL
jgi:hypothetical protein